MQDQINKPGIHVNYLMHRRLKLTGPCPKNSPDHPRLRWL